MLTSIMEPACSINPGSQLPLVLRPSDVADGFGDAAALQEFVRARLPRHGGILFRDFAIRSVAHFEAFVRRLASDLVGYEFGSTPRSHLGNRVYTSTEYPAHQSIPLHNEQAYTTEWPMKIWFYCAVPAEDGGETPIADSRKVFSSMPGWIKERFTAKRLMYVRNYGNGLDVPWQKVFNTTERSAVEAYCRKAGITYEWKADGELRTRQICPAVAVHPETAEAVWFNQAHLFHVSNLDTRVRDALLSVVSEEDLPRNVYYGDGTAIEVAVLDEIRDIYRRAEVRFPWQKGDVLMLDNMLTAHGRAPYKGPRQVLVAMAEPFSAGPRSMVVEAGSQ